MVEARQVASEIVDELQDRKNKDWSVLKTKMREGLKHFIYDKIGRDPMILPIIMEV